MTHLRIATWNMERPKLNVHAKNSRRLEKIREIDADLWILTETSSAIALDGYASLASESQPGYHSTGESFATIWSRWPIRRRIPTFDSFFAVCGQWLSLEPSSPMQMIAARTVQPAGGRNIENPSNLMVLIGIDYEKNSRITYFA